MSLEDVEAQMGKPATALVTQEPIGGVVEHTEPAEAITVPNAHNSLQGRTDSPVSRIFFDLTAELAV